MTTCDPVTLASRHLLLLLAPINRCLRGMAEQRAEMTARLTRAGDRGVCLTIAHVHHQLAWVDGLQVGHDHAAPDAAGTPMNGEETRRLERLRQTAADQGLALPWDGLVQSLQLRPFEQQALLLCVAPEIDTAYERIYAYIHDDVHRRAAGLELICGLEGDGLDRQARHRLLLDGLCRRGLLRITEHTANPRHRTYALGDGVLDILQGVTVAPVRGAGWRRRFADPEQVDLASALPLEVFPDHTALVRLAGALAVDSDCLLGVWGPRHHAARDVVPALAAAAGRALRRLPVDPDRWPAALDTAAQLDSALWLQTDDLDTLDGQQTARLAAGLGSARVPLIFSGPTPWHPLSLLTRKAVLDLHLAAPCLAQRRRWWHAVASRMGRELSPPLAEQLAARYQISPREMRASLRAGLARVRLHSNGQRYPLRRALPEACRQVMLRNCARFAHAILPRRGPDDLILPSSLHRRVLEVAAFHTAAARVDDDWGFGHLLSGGGGMKVLMTGDSGTGKTLAAEVIAGQVDPNQPLFKVDLASVVSKWVGETEKHLEEVFQQAEESHAVLFFDEADALFSKRGEVQRGTDRYANLEVGFLLQRLETFTGLAILASNHKDQIDDAFMRRFQIILHFPRPSVAERRRLWRLALPRQAPLADDIDLGVLESLDLTGAGIVGAARNAGLLAAARDAPNIDMACLVQAIARQFQNEARLLPASQLGNHAHLVEPPPVDLPAQPV